jgi:hypothetical protein
MSRLGAIPVSPANSCGPCLTEKQMKKQRAEEAKDLKEAINFLVRTQGYERDTMTVLGGLLCRLINNQGPLK